MNEWINELNQRLKSKCNKCDRSEDAEVEVTNAKEPSIVEEKEEDNKVECLAVEGNEENSLTRTSCHDSGIDISIPTVPVVPTKKV